MIPNLKKSQFTDIIARGINGFKEWIFCPGMLFNAEHKWWGNREKRSNNHEGLDLFMYMTSDGQVQCLDEKTEIPAIYGGTVVRVIDDFLGRSIFVEHGNGFITAFGHTKPLTGIETGCIVKEGDIIAAIAEIRDPKMTVSPHLHITAGWISGDLPYKTMDWKIIGASKMIELVDPLDIIGGNSVPLEGNSPVCRNL